ncbi:hypothetical protein E9976_25620 [Salmonella enterica]|nr:hypothetical protein [Salmonella enterica subsp. enterica serovar Hvittingfoss]
MPEAEVPLTALSPIPPVTDRPVPLPVAVPVTGWPPLLTRLPATVRAVPLFVFPVTDWSVVRLPSITTPLPFADDPFSPTLIRLVSPLT